MWNKEIMKKSDEELQEYLTFRRRHAVVRNKKGKGAYKRQQKKKDIQKDADLE